MRKAIVFILLLVCGAFTRSANPTVDLTGVIRSYQKSLKTSAPMSFKNDNYLKTLATMGILQGTVNVEKRMQQNTLRKLEDIKVQIEKKNIKLATKRLKQLTELMQRDSKAIEILQNTLRVSMTAEKFQDIIKALKVEDLKLSVNKNHTKIPKLTAVDFREIEKNILGQLKLTHDKVKATVYEIVNKMESSNKLKKKSSTPPTIASSIEATHTTNIANHDEIYVQMPVWPPLYQVDAEGFFRFRRQQEEGSAAEKADSEKIENQIGTKEISKFEDEFPQATSEGGGGITGLIASLSGGEGGLDVGALIGAISGVVTTLFGPGGLDVPTLISSGTSLIAGLLGGDENFGAVLASYLGIALEGLTGGGGADLNGAFFGNFVGTLLGQLSADPEEEAGPMPNIFIDNFYKGFEQTKQKRGIEDATSGYSKSYFFDFISNIVSSLVGGITNLVLSSSIGASGGSSQGSATASQTSSSSSSHHKPQALKVKI